MVNWKKTSVCLDAKEKTSLRELQMAIAVIAKVGPENQILCKGEQCMDNNKPLVEYGLNSCTAKAQALATVQLTFRDPGSGRFGTLDVPPVSSPPELPNVLDVWQ